MVECVLGVCPLKGFIQKEREEASGKRRFKTIQVPTIGVCLEQLGSFGVGAGLETWGGVFVQAVEYLQGKERFEI